MFKHKYGILALILLSSFGCGKRSGEVTGTVKGKATLDGKPVAAGCMISCQNTKNGLSAGGKVDADGSFIILMQDGPSIIAGDYKVLVQPPDLKLSHEEMMRLSMEKKLPKTDESVVPMKYRSYDTSKLFMIVKEGSNKCDIEMESKK